MRIVLDRNRGGAYLTSMLVGAGLFIRTLSNLKAQDLGFERERELLVSVRGGGHAVAGHAVCDGGLMIDLSLMKAVRVNPAARTVRAAGGMLWSE